MSSSMDVGSVRTGDDGPTRAQLDEGLTAEELLGQSCEVWKRRAIEAEEKLAALVKAATQAVYATVAAQVFGDDGHDAAIRALDAAIAAARGAVSAEKEFIERLLTRRPVLARRYLHDPIVHRAVAWGAFLRASDDAILETALAATCEKGDFLQAELVKHLEGSIPPVVFCIPYHPAAATHDASASSSAPSSDPSDHTQAPGTSTRP